MKDVRDNPFSFLDDWYGRLDDIIEDLKNNGFAVLNATNEFIDVSDENDKEYVLKLGGTERTITINKIESLDESLIPIQEYYDEEEWDDDELASIYGGDTKDSQKAIADEMKELYLDESSHPKLGKKVKSIKGWKIYQGTDDNGDEIFRCFTPDDDRPTIGYEDWETETLEQAISWIENYDLEESLIPINEFNKEIIKEGSEGESNDSENVTIVIERKTFGDYEKNVFNSLDNIEFLASSYKELNKDTLKVLISSLEEELEVLKDINMKLITGIKQITL